MAVVLGIIRIITVIALFCGVGLSVVMVVAWIVRVVRYTAGSRKK
jgi:hypothetical protein